MGVEPAGPLARVPLDELRRAMRTQAELGSARQLATEIGVTHRTVRLFTRYINPSTPHGVVRRKLEIWYAGLRAAEAQLPANVAALFDQLEATLPQAERARWRQITVAEWRRAYGEERGGTAQAAPEEQAASG